jgi:hypothetical protein
MWKLPFALPRHELAFRIRTFALEPMDFSKEPIFPVAPGLGPTVYSIQDLEGRELSDCWKEALE